MKGDKTHKRGRNTKKGNGSKLINLLIINGEIK